MRLDANGKIHVSETDTLKAILNYLEYRPGVYWRQNVGARKFENEDGSERWVKFGRKGTADITGIRRGLRIEIEVKAPGLPRKKQSPDQEKFQAMIEAEGGKYVLAYSVDDVMRAGL